MVKVSAEGGGRRPVDRGGRPGGSGDSSGVGRVLNPLLRAVLVVELDNLRSGKAAVGVVGDAEGSCRAPGFKPEFVSESPRAGLSTCRVELYDELEVAGESSVDLVSTDGGDAVTLVSTGGLIMRLGSSEVGELYDGERMSAFEVFLASAFLFLGTS